MIWQENANFVLLVSWEKENQFPDGDLMENFYKSDGLRERGRWENRKRKRELSERGSWKQKAGKGKLKKILGCCFQDFVLKRGTCSFFGRSKFGKANRGRNDFWPNLSQQLSWVVDNFTVKMRQVWRQVWAWNRGELQKPQVFKEKQEVV